MNYDGGMWVLYRGLKLPAIMGGGPPVTPPVSPPVSPPPPNIPLDFGSSAGLKGSLYVSSADVIYISNDNHAWGGTGVSVVSPAGAKPGSIWVDGEDFHYIDASGVDRTLQKTSLGAKPAPARQGSVWLDTGPTPGKALEWSGATNLYQWWNGL